MPVAVQLYTGAKLLADEGVPTYGWDINEEWGSHLTRCAAMELGEHNVRVNSVSPGAIATGILLKALGLDARAADSRAESMKAGFAKAQPIPRAGVPDDIAQCVVWLASDRASFINGTDIIVDGGMIGGRMYTPHQKSLKQMRTALQVPTQS